MSLSGVLAQWSARALPEMRMLEAKALCEEHGIDVNLRGVTVSDADLAELHAVVAAMPSIGKQEYKAALAASAGARASGFTSPAPGKAGGKRLACPGSTGSVGGTHGGRGKKQRTIPESKKRCTRSLFGAMKKELLKRVCVAHDKGYKAKSRDKMVDHLVQITTGNERFFFETYVKGALLGDVLSALCGKLPGIRLSGSKEKKIESLLIYPETGSGDDNGSDASGSDEDEDDEDDEDEEDEDEEDEDEEDEDDEDEDDEGEGENDE